MDQLKLNNYNIVRKDIGKKNRKGGTALIIHKKFTFTKIELLDSSNTDMLAIKLNIENLKINVISIYAYPKNELDIHQIDKIVDKKNGTIILGDFNSKHKQWFCKNNNKNGIILNNFIEAHNLEIINDSTPTFKRSQNIIDLMITTQNLYKKIDNFTTNDELESDHRLISFQLYLTNTNINKNNTVIRTNWKKYYKNLENMTNESEFREMNDINDKTTYLTKCINLAHEAAKFTITHKNKQIQQLPGEIIKLIKERRKLRRSFYETRKEDTKKKNNLVKKSIDEKIAKFKRDEWNGLCDKAKKQHISSSILWRKIKNINNNGTYRPKQNRR